MLSQLVRLQNRISILYPSPIYTCYLVMTTSQFISSLTLAGDDIKKLEEAYNQAQGHWADNMINACRDYERHEEERSDFLQGQWLKYIETCVAVNETSAMVRTYIDTP